jgi:hypothetical protein
LPINTYRTSASGVFHRKGFGFAICGNDRASVSQFVAGIGHGSPADFGKFIAGETEKWGKVIRAANIKPE